MVKLEHLTKEDKDLLKVPLEQTTPDGQVTMKDIRQIDKICKLLEQEGESLELEDVDYSYLINKFESFSLWNPSVDARKHIINVSEKLAKKNA